MESKGCGSQDMMVRVLHTLVETMEHVTCRSSEVACIDHVLVGLTENLLANLNLVAKHQKSQQKPWIGGR